MTIKVTKNVSVKSSEHVNYFFWTSVLKVLYLFVFNFLSFLVFFFSICLSSYFFWNCHRTRLTVLNITRYGAPLSFGADIEDCIYEMADLAPSLQFEWGRLFWKSRQLSMASTLSSLDKTVINLVDMKRSGKCWWMVIWPGASAEEPSSAWSVVLWGGRQAIG